MDEDTQFDQRIQEYAAAHQVGYLEALYGLIRADDQAGLLEILKSGGEG